MRYGAMIMLLVCAMLCGCVKQEERARRVAQDFIGYLKVLDTNGLKSTTTGQFHKDVETMEEMFAGQRTGEKVHAMMLSELSERMTNVTIRKVFVKGDSATVNLATSSASVTLIMEKTDKEWKVSNIQ